MELWVIPLTANEGYVKYVIMLNQYNHFYAIYDHEFVLFFKFESWTIAHNTVEPGYLHDNSHFAIKIHKKIFASHIHICRFPQAWKNSQVANFVEFRF